MSDSNTTSLAYSEETSFGVLPANPQFALLRVTGESLAANKQTVVSQEIRPDRMTADLARVGLGAGGSLNFELSANSYDDFIGAALCASPTVINITTAGTATINATSQVMTSTAGVFSAVPIGSFVRVSGAGTANNGVKLVIAKAGDGSTLTFAPGSFGANVTAAITLSSKVWSVGTQKRFFTIERGILTPSGNDRFFQRFNGMMVNQWSVNMTTEQIITGVFEMLGRTGTTDDASLDPAGIAVTAATSTSTHLTFTVASHSFVVGNRVSVAGITPAAYNGEWTVTSTTGTTVVVASTANPAAGSAFGTIRLATPASYTAASTTPVMRGSCASGFIWLDNVTSTIAFKTLNFTLNNNLRGRTKLFDCGNFDVGLGTADITGQLNAYCEDNTLIKRMIEHTYGGLAYLTQDSDGRGFGVNFPRANLSTAQSPATGLNTDVMIDATFQAILDPTAATSMIVSSTDAPA